MKRAYAQGLYNPHESKDLAITHLKESEKKFLKKLENKKKKQVNNNFLQF